MTRNPAPPAQPSGRFGTRQALASGAVVVVVVVLVVVSLNRDDGPAEPAVGDAPELDLARRVDGDPVAMGNVDAPVVLVEFADFRCPFCGVFAQETQPELVSRYVDTDVLRIEWRDLPVFGDQSIAAALAARAAGRQDRFWEFHEAVFAIAPSRGKADLSRQRLLELADEAGVPDLEQLEADMADPDLHAELQADIDEATSLGATSTPVFLVNDRPIIGAQPLEVFAEAIEAEHAEQGA